MFIAWASYQYWKCGWDTKALIVCSIVQPCYRRDAFSIFNVRCSVMWSDYYTQPLSATTTFRNENINSSGSNSVSSVRVTTAETTTTIPMTYEHAVVRISHSAWFVYQKSLQFNTQHVYCMILDKKKLDFFLFGHVCYNFANFFSLAFVCVSALGSLIFSKFKFFSYCAFASFNRISYRSLFVHLFWSHMCLHRFGYDSTKYLKPVCDIWKTTHFKLKTLALLADTTIYYIYYDMCSFALSKFLMVCLTRSGIS